MPHEIEFVDDLPKSNVGKVLRRELKDLNDETAASRTPSTS
jgi:acyl-coenzyme A synthetase/AMP-(fatty) acid ligase